MFELCTDCSLFTSQRAVFVEILHSWQLPQGQASSHHGLLQIGRNWSLRKIGSAAKLPWSIKVQFQNLFSSDMVDSYCYPPMLIYASLNFLKIAVCACVPSYGVKSSCYKKGVGYRYHISLVRTTACYPGQLRKLNLESWIQAPVYWENLRLPPPKIRRMIGS